MILAFETNGNMSIETKGFIKFIAQCIALKNPDMPDSGNWFHLITRKIQHSLALNVAQKNKLCHNFNNNNGNDNGTTTESSGDIDVQPIYVFLGP